MHTSPLVQTFLREADELLTELEEGFLELESGAKDGELVDSLFRAAHTLKGNAGMVGFAEFVRLTHVTENVLEQLRARTLGVSGPLAVALLAALDQLRSMSASWRDDGAWAADMQYELAIAGLLEACDGAEAMAAPAPERVLKITLYLRADAQQAGHDPAELLREIGLLGETLEVETLRDRLLLADSDASGGQLGFRLLLRTTASQSAILGFCCLAVDEEDIAIEVLGDAGEAAVEPAAATVSHEVLPVSTGEATASAARRTRGDKLLGSTVRIDTSKLDGLLDLVGELVIGISQVQNQSGSDTVVQRGAAVERLGSLGRELQDLVMSLRMLPAHETFERFRRPMRDLAKELEKPFEFETRGSETQLDRKVLEQLVDPLKHMLRNCVAHGLESAAERRAAGKSAIGRVVLSAMQREGHVVIEISDDGRGIDPARVQAKAEERGLLKTGQKLSTAQCHELLFSPGFSTAEELSELSGRGVGLDVVWRNIQSLRGRVEIDSELGKGTTFRIRLPLTLAIVEGMNVSVGQETVTIPLPSVIELIAPGPRTVQTIEGKHEYVDVRGELLPMLRLSHVLALPGRSELDSEARIVLVETERRRFGLLVDRVLGMAQTVIKPLDQSYDLFQRMSQDFVKPRSVGGAAILGDGNIGIILDVHGLESTAFGVA